jgi:hypothetical protein
MVSVRPALLGAKDGGPSVRPYPHCWVSYPINFPDIGKFTLAKKPGGNFLTPFSGQVILIGMGTRHTYFFFSLISIAAFPCCYSSGRNTGDAASSDDSHEESGEDVAPWDGEPEDASDIADMEQEDQDSYCPFGKIVGDTQMTFHTAPFRRAWGSMLAFTGSELGLAWGDSRNIPPRIQIFFTRLSLSGEKLQDDTLISELDDVEAAYMVFDGDSFALVWPRMYGDPAIFDIVFSRVSAAGEKIGHDTIVHESEYVGFPVMAAAGDGFGLLCFSP